MDSPTLDLLQFHWWEYSNAAYLDAMKALQELKEEGKLAHVGLTNFDTEHLKRIEEAGVKVAINQVCVVDHNTSCDSWPCCRSLFDKSIGSVFHCRPEGRGVYPSLLMKSPIFVYIY